MTTSQSHRAFAVSAGWTLLLLFLGSVVHATGSSLACPDWPTCHGTMVPAMEGGVFWEHLHRLVAGGLILMWLLTGWLVRSEGLPAPVRRGWGVGMALLVVQAVFGGVTVLLKLPAAVSTTHLGLAFLFLALTTALAVATSAGRGEPFEATPAAARALTVWTPRVAGLVFMQSLLGGLVRHTKAGMACPDVPLCLGRVVPALDQPAVALQFAHRVVALVTALVVIAVAAAIARGAPGRLRRLAIAAIVLVLVQVGLGVLSVTSRLAVAPVSLHTVVAARLFATWVMLAAHGRVRAPARARGGRAQPVAAR